MKAKDSMLCWNTDSDQVEVVPHPDVDRLSDKYEMTCPFTFPSGTSRKPKTFAEMQAIVFIEALHLIVRDKVDPTAVHKALSVVDEYREGCSADMPRFSA